MTLFMSNTHNSDDDHNGDPFENTGDVVPYFSDVCQLHNESTSKIGKVGNAMRGVVVRISGSQFSNFSQYITYHEPLIHNCFIEVTNKLVSKYNAQTGYTVGDNILLFFSREENLDEVIYTNTQIVCTEIVSYATIVFDKCFNLVVGDVAQKYSNIIANFMLEEDLIFRGISIPCDEEEMVKYLYYVIYRATEYNDEESANYGSIVKPALKPEDDLQEQEAVCCTYRTLTQEDYIEDMFNVEFLLNPYCLLQKIKK